MPGKAYQQFLWQFQDRLEGYYAIGWRYGSNHRFAKSLTAWMPEYTLEPNQRYEEHLLVRAIVIDVLGYFCFNIIVLSGLFGYIWFKDSRLRKMFFNPQTHAQTLTVLTHMIMVLLICEAVCGFVALAVIALLYRLPSWYFWNRRAARLAQEKSVNNAGSNTVPIDNSVWPPPPNRVLK